MESRSGNELDDVDFDKGTGVSDFAGDIALEIAVLSGFVEIVYGGSPVGEKALIVYPIGDSTDPAEVFDISGSGFSQGGEQFI